MNILKNKVNDIKESVNNKIERVGKKRFTIIASCLSVLILAGGTATAVALTGGFNNMDKEITTSQTQNKTDEQNKDNKAEEKKQEEQATQNIEEGTADNTESTEATEENATAGDNNGATNNNTSNRGSGAGANNNANAGTNNVATATQPAQEQTKVHVHNWATRTIQGHWVEQKLVGEHNYCNLDGALVDTTAQLKSHYMHCKGSYSLMPEYETIDHPAITQDYCTECGATK